MLIQLGQWSRLGFSTRTRTGRGRERTASSPACSRPPLPAATHGHGRRLFRRSAAPDECRMSWTRKRAAWHPTTGRRPASLACYAHSSSRRSLSSAARATGEPGGILSCLGIPPLLRSAYRAAGGADPSGVSMFRTRETGWFRGRVAGTHYRAPAPSEPDKPVFRASRLEQARTEPAKPTGAGMPTQMPHRDYNELQLPYQSNLHWQGHSHPATSCRTALCTPGQAVPARPEFFPAAACRFSTASPVAPDRNPPRDASVTRHQQGFTVIHPTPAFPSPVTPDGTGSLGFSLSFAPSRAGPGSARQGGDRPGHCLDYVSGISQPPSTYSLTTCGRTSQRSG